MNKIYDINSGRKLVDEIDDKILSLLAERFRVTRQIGVYKAEHSVSARDYNREEVQLSAIAKKAKARDLNPELARSLLQAIIDEAVKEHQDMQTEHKA